MKQSEYSMRKSLMRTSWVLFALILVILTSVGLQLKGVQEEFKLITDNELVLNRLSGQVLHLDEVLTMSTHMAAITGETFWEQRYRKNVQALDSVLNLLHELAPSVYETDADNITNSANNELVRMENAAFDSVRKGKLEEAQQVMTSAAYQQQKRIYSDGIKHMLSGIEVSVSSKLDIFNHLLHKLLISIGMGVLCLIILWMLAYRISALS